MPWILRKTERGGTEFIKEIDGVKYTFIQQGFSWDLGVPSCIAG